MHALRLSPCALLATLACGGAEADPASDSRTPLPLPAEAAAGVRAEMHTMLSSINAILVALPARDSAAVRTAATAAGMGVAADTALETLLPEPFLRLGVTTHQGFDSLAAAATQPTDSILTRLGRITSNCVSCHAQYRIVLN